MKPTDLASAAMKVVGLPIWEAWRGAGSHLFFEMGEPRVQVRDRLRQYDVGGNKVSRRTAHVSGSQALVIEMAGWRVLAGNSLVGHSESSDNVFDSLLRWMQGQHLAELERSGSTDIFLRFDLGATFELYAHPGAEPGDVLVSIRNDHTVTSLRADGMIVNEPYTSS